jgi:hypothetical protein
MLEPLRRDGQDREPLDTLAGLKLSARLPFPFDNFLAGSCCRAFCSK